MVKHGVIHCSLAAIRKAPTEKSEMINQMLFGECIIVQKVLLRWQYVESVYDGFAGWINGLSLVSLADDQLIHFESENSTVLPRLSRAVIHGKGDSTIHLVPGSVLPSYRGENGEFHLGGQQYSLDCPVEQDAMRPDRKRFVDTGFSFLNSPYLWGGRSPFGIDSPGLIQVVGKIHGICLPREIGQQVTIGSTVNFIEEAKPGDLAFFDDEEGEFAHAGIIVDKGRILHASGSVRIDALDHQGIFREDIGEYTHRLRVVKNIIDPE
jgi:hypothetical protein